MFSRESACVPTWNKARFVNVRIEPTIVSILGCGHQDRLFLVVFLPCFNTSPACMGQDLPITRCSNCSASYACFTAGHNLGLVAYLLNESSSSKSRDCTGAHLKAGYPNKEGPQNILIPGQGLCLTAGSLQHST